MMIGVGLSITNIRGGGEPPIITATLDPAAYSYSDGDTVGDHPDFATLAATGNYASTAGTISTVEWLVNGTDQASGFTLSAGESVVVRVTDSAANTRDWTIDASVAATVPDAFTAGDWSVDVDELTITTLPDDGGSALTDIEYRVDLGSAVSTGETTTGTYAITAADGADVQIRAVNAVGAGAWSDTKTVSAGSSLPASVVLALSAARRVNTNYTGDLIRVRRSSDNAEADIGFDGSGDLDETALLAHTGTGTGDHGYIVTVYEQHGAAGAVDWAQSTASVQPRIVTDGVVETQNSRAAAWVPSNGDPSEFLTLTGWSGRTTNMTVFLALNISNAAGKVARVLGLSNSDGHLLGACRQGNTNVGSLSLNAGDSMSFYRNGTLVGSDDDGVTTQNDMWAAFGNAGLGIMRGEDADLSSVAAWANLRTKWPNGGFWESPEYFSELIIADAPSAGDVSTIEGDQITYYGITP